MARLLSGGLSEARTTRTISDAQQNAQFPGDAGDPTAGQDKCTRNHVSITHPCPRVRRIRTEGD